MKKHSGITIFTIVEQKYKQKESYKERQMKMIDGKKEKREKERNNIDVRIGRKI